MSRELLYATTTTTQSVLANSVIPLTTVTRRVGCATTLSGNEIILRKVGYYHISGTVTFTAGAGISSIAINQDGTAVVGATSAVTTVATDNPTYTLPIDAIVKVKCPCFAPSAITIVNGATALSIGNVAITVEYLG